MTKNTKAKRKYSTKRRTTRQVKNTDHQLVFVGVLLMMAFATRFF